MHPAVSAGPVALRYDVRGPEFAVVLPDGDLGAVREVTERLSQMWNGPGTLLLTADEEGALGPGLEDSLAALGPDHVLLHPALAEEARAALGKRWPARTGPWRVEAVDREVHPWWLVRDRSAEPAALHVPQPTTDAEAVLAAVLWGWIDPDDVEEIRTQFQLMPAASEDFAATLLHAQIRRASPLGWAARFMGFTESVNGPSQRALFVFEDTGSFHELVLFWNLRARYPAFAGEPAVLGITLDVLGHDSFATAIADWLAQPPYGTKPDLRVAATEATADAVRQGLTDAGLTFVDCGGRWTSYSVVPEERRDPEFTFAPLTIPQRLRRGTRSEALVGLREGHNPVHLPLPGELPPNLGWHGLVRVELRGLPVAFPMSDPLAAACLDNGIAAGRDAIAVAFGGNVSPVRTEIRVPPADVQLERHMTSVALRAELSGAGQIARTLLGRLDGLADLDPLADPEAPKILGALVAPSRKKLAQRVGQELQRIGLAQIDERLMVELLRKEGLFAELETRTLAQLQGATGSSADALLPALGALCNSGYLQRGRALRCPRCRTPDYWRLAELDERLRCRACRQEFVLPAVEDGAEARVAYRLDGLVGRAMDQDLAPVLLTLRHLLRRPECSADAQWWPGLNLYESGSPNVDHEIDLLVADHGRLRICEVKVNAHSFTRELAVDLLELAARLGAEGVLAAPTGEWPNEVVELFDEYDFLLLGPELLLERERA